MKRAIPLLSLLAIAACGDFEPQVGPLEPMDLECGVAPAGEEAGGGTAYPGSVAYPFAGVAEGSAPPCPDGGGSDAGAYR
jgi:hypothetical protein